MNAKQAATILASWPPRRRATSLDPVVEAQLEKAARRQRNRRKTARRVLRAAGGVVG